MSRLNFAIADAAVVLCFYRSSPTATVAARARRRFLLSPLARGATASHHIPHTCIYSCRHTSLTLKNTQGSGYILHEASQEIFATCNCYILRMYEHDSSSAVQHLVRTIIRRIISRVSRRQRINLQVRPMPRLDMSTCISQQNDQVPRICGPPYHKIRMLN